MTRTSSATLFFAVLAAAGLATAADDPRVPPAPSANLGIAVDVTPVAGTAGQFAVASVITDLENNTVVARPRLTIGTGQPGRIEMGVEGEWMISISVSADGTSRQAHYEATYTRDGKPVSRQQVSVNLEG